MFEKDSDKKDNCQPVAGRVVDLRKGFKDEASKTDAVLSSANKMSSLKLRFSFFGRKNKTFNFLKHYLRKEKEESFIDQEILRESLDEAEEDLKLRHLSSFTSKIARFWWLPLFVIALIWRLTWKMNKSKNKEISELKLDDAKEEEEEVVVELKKQVEIKKVDVSPVVNNQVKADVLVLKKKADLLRSLVDLFGAILSWPKSILSFLSGRTTEDYLYQKVLLDEVVGKKFNPFKKLVSFAAIVFVVLLPIKVLSYYKVVDFDDLKGRVLGVSERAVGNLGSAADSVSTLDLNSAIDNFSQAKNNFSEAKSELEKINSLLLEAGKMVPNKKVRLASHGKDFLNAGEAASSLGEHLALATNSFFSNKDKKMSEMIEDFLINERAALLDAEKLNSSLDKIDASVLPDEYRPVFAELKTSSKDLEELLRSASDIVEKLNIFLGAKSDKRYLFVFENNSEMRASGGFIGSFALVDFSQGKIKNIEVPGGGSYDTESDLKKFIISPEPMWLVNPLWHFWDANWWPDWKKSAQKLSWFYEKSGGPTVDGVIAFTPTVLERLLKVVGPIDMTEKYGVTMDSENLWLNLRDIIEKENAQDQSLPNDVVQKKPKKIIGELFGRIIEEMPKRLNRENFSALVSSLNDSLNDKQMMFYFSDEELQAEAEKRNWAGRIKETGKDYLYVINTNIAGGKSDGKMKEQINHQVKIEEDGSIIDTLTIKKTHQGVVDEPYYGVRNVNWLRVYVPKGSELISASGFRGPDAVYFETPDKDWEKDLDLLVEDSENAIIDKENLNTKIYQESDKTVFANWVMVDPGQEVIITLKYKLPFKLEKKTSVEEAKSGWEGLMEKFIKTEKKDLYVYSLMVQKQPGMRFSSIKSSLSAPEGMKTVWKYPSELKAVDGWVADEELTEDKYWAVLFEKIISE